MDAQLSFIDFVTVKVIEEKTPSPWEKLATGLKASRMGVVDREEHLHRQIERMKEHQKWNTSNQTLNDVGTTTAC